MKIKTISKIISNKFDEFLDSIKDDAVKALVKDNTIITGGCIPSMLLQTPINDFDLYFTNKETVVAVANYFLSLFQKESEHTHTDGKEIRMWIDDSTERVKIHLKSAGIAGGASDSNYKYFESRPPEEGEDWIEQACEQVSEADTTKIDLQNKEKYRPVFLSANAITLSDKIQIIVRFYGNPDEIHQHYDYIHCTSYWLSADKKLTLKPEALQSILTKELVYIGSKYPICSLIRTRKFIKRGFTINAGQYLKMCFQVSNLDLTNLEVLEDQLIGVDAAYFGQLIDGLKEHSEKNKEKGEEFKLDYGYLATIIDKIF